MKPTTRERATNAGLASAPRPRILVADADAETRARYRQSLGSAGCDVVEASDGRDAIVTALMQPPTLVITEISLPYIDGYALCEVLRHDRATSDVPILVVTTEARPAQISRAQRAGADVVLIKPAAMNTILTEVRRLVGQPSDPVERDTTTTATAITESDQTAALVGGSTHTRPLSKSFRRSSTKTPPESPPQLVCPLCDRLLIYEHSEIGGVSRRHLEQWDYYACATCGMFQHRQRTHTLRNVS
jgi:CheY-like chemotaxis protein